VLVAAVDLRQGLFVGKVGKPAEATRLDVAVEPG
jgi:hypothetical protein